MTRAGNIDHNALPAGLDDCAIPDGSIRLVHVDNLRLPPDQASDSLELAAYAGPMFQGRLADAINFGRDEVQMRLLRRDASGQIIDAAAGAEAVSSGALLGLVGSDPGLAWLADRIEADGLLQPLLVHPDPDYPAAYEVLDGARRLAAVLVLRAQGRTPGASDRAKRLPLTPAIHDYFVPAIVLPRLNPEIALTLRAMLALSVGSMSALGRARVVGAAVEMTALQHREIEPQADFEDLAEGSPSVRAVAGRIGVQASEVVAAYHIRRAFKDTLLHDGGFDQDSPRSADGRAILTGCLDWARVAALPTALLEQVATTPLLSQAAVLAELATQLGRNAKSGAVTAARAHSGPLAPNTSPTSLPDADSDPKRRRDRTPTVDRIAEYLQARNEGPGLIALRKPASAHSADAARRVLDRLGAVAAAFAEQAVPGAPVVRHQAGPGLLVVVTGDSDRGKEEGAPSFGDSVRRRRIAEALHVLADEIEAGQVRTE